MVEPGAHAALRRDNDPLDRRLARLSLDQAGWHMPKALVVPGNITLVPLPPRSPELNPPLGDCMQSPAGQRAENISQSIRENWLSYRVFGSDEDIVACSCEAWNHLIDQPRKIMTIDLPDWAHRL